MAKKQLKITDIKDKTIKEAFKEFILHCRIKNLTSASQSYYEVCFGIFTDFIDGDTKVSNINKDIVNDFILYLRNKNLADASINSQLVGTRVFLYYCMKLGYIEEFKINKVKAEKTLKETYTDAELNILLKKPNIKTCDFVEYRDWVVINTFLGTGMRAGTLCNLRIKDVDFFNEVIYYKVTKNRKQQIVPISNTLLEVIKEYVAIRNANDDDWLFCSRYGDKLTVNALTHSIKKYNNRRGVMRTGVHKFRHTFAKKWILAGGDMFRLQKVLGHSSLDMVKEYVTIFNDDLKKGFNEINPLEILQKSKKGKSIKMK